MRIAVLTINYAPEPIGIGPYSAQMAQSLAARGHEVTVIAAKPYYPGWRVDREWRGGWRVSREGGVRVVRCPLYVPASPSGLKRLVHHVSFLLTSGLAALRERMRGRFDAVVAVAPSLMAAPVAVLAARSCRARSWVHVQDFELEAALATDLLGKGSLLARTGAAVERSIFRRFDHASSISPQMCARLVDKAVPADRVSELRNWSDPPAPPLASAPDYRRDWGLGDRIVALYSGNIANKQGIDIIVDAARLLRERADIAFVVCGEGPNREQLVRSAEGLGNIEFHDLQPREHLAAMLACADLHLLPQRPEAADLVLPSKLCNMLASGRPVIATAAAGTGIAEEIAGCGIATEPGDAAALAAAIAALADDPARREAMGREAVLRARERWSADAILSRFEADLVALAGKRGQRA
ncbi:WcaI family glycosyltransferase [Novosphingobium album (ex Liu et al. 2023)]|uniref:WcaI family glycosyltransferase n=1 Tax=Novosphingobium album (ex Liu et al. 2023) TaxID=3031130 RepID=A0ABT5WK99_9SPHN|nr:WcaI family glycosyltransferase [Novosphingobium album (ex Liu et al. 2023)]MDE8650470.1 WcaI family glycosyltransferase [Novosphingobium album (ex Liu et al. 2023)]